MQEYTIDKVTSNYGLNTQSSILSINYPIISYINIEIVQENGISEQYIPISVLKNNSSFEAIVYYLKCELGLSLKRISDITARDQRTIWNVYHQAAQKRVSYDIEHSAILVPVSILRNRLFSVLESVVFHLSTEYGLSSTQIASTLGKSRKTIYTIQKRLVKKIGNYNA